MAVTRLIGDFRVRLSGGDDASKAGQAAKPAASDQAAKPAASDSGKKPTPKKSVDSASSRTSGQAAA